MFLIPRHLVGAEFDDRASHFHFHHRFTLFTDRSTRRLRAVLQTRIKATDRGDKPTAPNPLVAVAPAVIVHKDRDGRQMTRYDSFVTSGLQVVYGVYRDSWEDPIVNNNLDLVPNS